MQMSLKSQQRFLSRPLGSVAQAGMSLIEIIIVMALIGTIMSILITNITGKSDKVKEDATRVQMQNVYQALQLYRVHNYQFPTTEQGLQALVTAPPDAKKWRGPYIEEEKLKDPFGEDFKYESDGSRIKIRSSGIDRKWDTDDDLAYPEDTEKDKAAKP